MKAGTLKSFIPRKESRYLLRLIGVNIFADKEIHVEPIYQATFELHPFKGGLMITLPWKEEYLIVVLRWRRPFVELARTGFTLEDESSDVGG